jgi:hypothetical protein
MNVGAQKKNRQKYFGPDGEVSSTYACGAMGRAIEPRKVGALKNVPTVI